MSVWKPTPEDSFWKLTPWLILFGLGLLVVFWIAGLIFVLIFPHAFGLDLVGYHGHESAELPDHLRYLAIGAVVLIGGWAGLTVFEKAANFFDNRRYRREKDARDLANYRAREADELSIREAKRARKAERKG